MQIQKIQESYKKGNKNNYSEILTINTNVYILIFP